jgi:hypothetical protein
MAETKIVGIRQIPKCWACLMPIVHATIAIAVVPLRDRGGRDREIGGNSVVGNGDR